MHPIERIPMHAPIHSIALDFPPLKRAMGILGDGTPGIIPSFVIGQENALLMELISPTGISELASRAPIFLYGVSGAGKTTVGLTVSGRYSMVTGSQQLAITTGADFARQFGHAAEADDMDRFRARHRDVDLLFLDGVHELASKETAQEELIHTIDILMENRKPIVFTAPKLAGSIRGLRAALSSRLMGGFSVMVQPPGLEARGHILNELNRALGANLSEQELSELAIQLPVNCTALQLRGVLLQWLHQQRLSDRRDDSLRHVIETQHQLKVPPISDIAKAVARQLGVKLSDLRGNTRKSNIVRARGLAMLLARQMTGLSLQQIGAFFGDRDHTTVLHALRKTENDMQNDSDLNRAAEEIRQSFA